MRKLLKKRQIHVVGGIDALKNNEGVVIELIRELIDGKRVSKNIEHLKEVTVNSFFLDNSHPLEFPLFTDGLLKSKLNLDNLLHIVNFFKYHITSYDEHSLHAGFHTLPDDEKPKAWDSPVKAGLQKLGTHWKGCSAHLHNGTKLTSHLRGNNPGYCPTQIVASAQSHINLTRPHSSHIYSDVMDNEENEDGFLSMHLDFSRPKAPWPLNFESHLTSESSASAWDYEEPAKDVNGGIRASDRCHQFQGFGRDFEKYRCVGYVSALPAQDPQDVHKVHGFQRMTMMKWADDEGKAAPTSVGSRTVVEKHLEDMQMCDLADEELAHWAYEGVVLPGGKIMLGRWWSPHETPVRDLVDSGEPRVYDRNERKCTGPFIFWNIDGAESVKLCEDCAL
ncbi:hypothetical protein MMC27_005664 [Xylographa pallens]|nr:hypothetical protein [Xylographa pallens]